MDGSRISGPHRGLKRFSGGFTLVELLTVVAVVSVLAAMLLPALGSAKGKARRVGCAVNLAALGRAFALYTVDGDGRYPAAFYYRGTAFTEAGQVPTQPAEGYTHWSGLLLAQRLAGQEVFRCPAFARGGLPPANTTPENTEPGQRNEAVGVVDDQAVRCAFTVNQALLPANHFVPGFQGSYRACAWVRDTSVANPAGTILATEWATDWQRLACESAPSVCRSYLPVHGFAGLGAAGIDRRYDSRQFGCPRPCLAAMRRLTPADLSSSFGVGDRAPRLDWVGRNHPSRGIVGSASSNFLFADGHVGNTTVFDTLQPFQWGQQFHSLRPGDDIAD